LHPPSRTRSSASPEAALNALIPSGDVRKTITALPQRMGNPLAMGKSAIDWKSVRKKGELERKSDLVDFLV